MSPSTVKDLPRVRRSKDLVNLTVPPKFGGPAGNIGVVRTTGADKVDIRDTGNPDRAVDVLRELGASLAAMHKATVFYRLLLGQHLMVIQANEYWRRIERRDYRKNPAGTPLWIREKDRTYSSWYNFLEEGFEHITGLTRQTAYSAMKLAASPCLAALPAADLQNFKRLANALEVVAAERRGITITPELISQAQEMTIETFRKTARPLGSACSTQKTIVAPTGLLKFLKTVAVTDHEAVRKFWGAIEHALKTPNQNPVQSLQTVTERIMTCGEEDSNKQNVTVMALCAPLCEIDEFQQPENFQDKRGAEMAMAGSVGSATKRTNPRPD